MLNFPAEYQPLNDDKNDIFKQLYSTYVDSFGKNFNYKD